MKTRGSTNKSPTKYVAENKFNTVICLRMGKTNTAKTPPGNFKVTTPENPLLSKLAYDPHNARTNFIYYS